VNHWNTVRWWFGSTTLSTWMSNKTLRRRIHVLETF